MEKSNHMFCDVSLPISKKPSQLDQLLRTKFNDSLRYLFAQLHEQIPFQEDQLDLMSERILARRITPRAFAQFYGLVLNIDQTDVDETKEILEKVVALTESETSLQILPYVEDALGDEYLLFPKLIFSGFAHGNPMAPPNDVTINRYTKDISRALEIIQLVDKELYNEFNALITMIVFCDKNTDDRVKPFGGASSLMVWGGLFLNTKTYSCTEEIAAGLVHELTHTALFGINEQETLVLNPINDSFSSPLRKDDRPMDGIYHATIVSARISLFLRKLRNHSVFHELDTKVINLVTEEVDAAFYNGLKVVNEDAVLSKSAEVLIKRFTNSMNAFT